MKRLLFATAAAIVLAPLAAHAQSDAGTKDNAQDWKGTGELGFAATRGNTKSTALNARLEFSKEDDTWKHKLYVTALRNKSEATVERVIDGETVSTEVFETTASRFEVGASSGYKLNLRSYIVGALRYENDDFAPYEWQAAASIGYGYIVIKNERTDLSFEIGPGYKRVQPVDYILVSGEPPMATLVQPDADGSVIGRGLMHFRHQITQSTAFEDTLLIEAGDSQFYQNDAGVVVDVSDKLALKVGYQVRYNSEATRGSEQTDQLLTTNLVYNF